MQAHGPDGHLGTNSERVMLPRGPGHLVRAAHCGVQAATRPHLRIEERESLAGGVNQARQVRCVDAPRAV
jgi:hypothetical protein